MARSSNRLERFPLRDHRLRWTRCVALTAAILLAIGSALGVDQVTTPSTASAASSVTVPAYRQANQVAVLTVHGVIDNVTLMSLERRIKKAVDEGADAIVLDINTPGGEMFSTLEICSLLKNRNDTPANIVAWVHPNAYSAGTIIALACREIVVAPGSTMGDAAPIDLFGRQISPTERAKVLSPLLTEIIDSARRNHYDEKLVQSFVMLGIELWLIEHVTTGERVFVDRTEYRRVFGDDPPVNVTPVAPSAATIPGQSQVRPLIDQSIERISEHAALDPEALRRQIEFEQLLPSARQPLSEADRDQWRLLMQVTDGTTLLTVKPDEAVFFGLSSAVVANDADVQAFFGAQTVRRYDQTWSENLVRFLISWPVRAILITIFLICLFIELAAPGFGVFGITAIVALSIVIGAPALAGMAQWWDILLIFLGIVLVLVELFLLPGLGVAGMAGVLCLLVGLVGTFVSGEISSAHGQTQLWTGLLATLLAVFVAGFILWFISRQMQSIPILNRIILQTELKDQDTLVASGVHGGRIGMLEAMGAAPKQLQPGDTGVAATDLRPSGRAMVNGKLFDVVAVGSFLEKGTTVRVSSVGRFVIEVEDARS